MTKSFQKFKKKAAQLAVAVTLVGASVIGASAAMTQGVTTGSVNLREDASSKSKSILKIKAQEDLTILGTEGNWYKVDFDGQEGYVYKTYVNKVNVEEGDITIKTLSSMNVRTMPSTSSKSKSVGKLTKGQVVKVIGQTENNWYAINYGGSVRYISGSAKYTQVVENGTTNTDVKGTATVENVKTYANIRQGAGSTYAKVATAPKGEKVEILGNVFKGWVKVRYQNVTGYAAVSCLSSLENEAPMLSVKDTYTVILNATFKNEDLGAKASDKEDGEATITYAGTVDTTKVGEYKVTVTATDSQGAKTDKVVTVKVVENTAPVMYCDYISGTPLQLEVGQKFDVSLLDAQVLDKEDGELTIEYVGADKIDTTKATVSTNYQEVVLRAVDKNGAKVEKTALIKVVEDTAPKFEGTFSIEIGLKSALTKESLFKATGLKAYDRQSSTNAVDITSSVEVLYMENVNTNVKGDYTVMLKVTDKGQTATQLVTVKVVDAKDAVSTPATDRTNPDIFLKGEKVTSTKEITVRKYSKFTNDMLEATAKDAMDNAVKVEITGTVDTSRDEADTLTLVATDSLGRKTTVTVTVNKTTGSSSTQATESYIVLSKNGSGDSNTVVNGDRVTIKKSVVTGWTMGALDTGFKNEVEVKLQKTDDNSNIDSIEVSFEGLTSLNTTSTEWQTIKVNVKNTDTNQVITKTIFVQIAE